MNFVYSPKDPNRLKLWSSVTFMKYIASVFSLIFLPKTLIWNKITFPASDSLNFAELMENELLKNISKKSINIPFSIQFLAAYCKNFKELDNFQKSSLLHSILLIMNYQSSNKNL